MYKSKDFEYMFGNNSDTEYLLRTVLLVQKRFKEKDVCYLEELIGLYDSWSNRACIDKLCELGYIKLVKQGNVSNHNEYRNVKL